MQLAAVITFAFKCSLMQMEGGGCLMFPAVLTTPGKAVHEPGPVPYTSARAAETTAALLE